MTSDLRALGRQLAAMVGSGRVLEVPASVPEEAVEEVLAGIEEALGYRPPVVRRPAVG